MFEDYHIMKIFIYSMHLVLAEVIRINHGTWKLMHIKSINAGVCVVLTGRNVKTR